MLYYEIHTPSENNPPIKGEWHVGEDVPKDATLWLPVASRVLVQADGDELNHIFVLFPSLPVAKGYDPRGSGPRPKPVQVWTGDFAEFILRNLQSDRTHDGWALAYLMNR